MTTEVTPARLREFFNPRSVALIGVSDRNDMSWQVHRNLRMHDYDGQAFYVNSRRDEVHGQRTVRSLSAIGEPIDLAFVILGGDAAVDSVREAASLGIRNLVVLSGGFKEADAHGTELQSSMAEVARANDQLILGPNTIGFINRPGRVVLYGSPNGAPIRQGPIGVVAQSGVLLATSLNNLPRRGSGVSTLAAVGNEAVISIDQVIDYLVEDEHTRVISIFLETTRYPERFRRAALRALEAHKPIVALASARTDVSISTALTHTGALVGDQRVTETALEELGVIMTKLLEDLFVTSSLLANYGPLPGRRVAFASVSGGLCELFADRAVEVGLEMPQFTEETNSRLREIIPSFGAAKNPLDFTGVGQTDRGLLPRTLEVISKDPNIDAVAFSDNLIPGEVPDLAPYLAAGQAIGAVTAASPVPVLPVAPVYADLHPVNLEVAEATGRGYEIGGAEHGALAMERSAWWSERRRAVISASPPSIVTTAAGLRAPLLPADTGRAWTEHEVLTLLDSAGVPTAPHILCTDESQVTDAARQVGYPVVVKVSSPDIAHKSRIGGVVLNVAGDAAAVAAFRTVTQAARRSAPEARVVGALVMPMRPAGLELIAGVTRDKSWGQVLAVGLGGVWTEMLSDTVLCILPTTPARIREQLGCLRGARLLNGGHGQPPADLARLTAVIAAIAEIAWALGDQLESLEVNPLRVDASTAEALDGLITWRLKD